MKIPGWLESEVAAAGLRCRDGEITRQEAITVLRDAIVAQDRELWLGIVSAFAGKALDRWEAGAPATGRLGRAQTQLLPGLPSRLHIRPGVQKAPITFTGHDWDMARRMVLTTAANAITGAERLRDRFEAAYGRVRPLLSGAATTADVAAQITAQPQPGQLAAMAKAP